MISCLDGEVLSASLSGAVIMVGGVGLAVTTTPATGAGLRVGERSRLHTSLVVREDSLTLFGFADPDERDTFELLQSVSGVGPKLALAMLAVHPPVALARAIESEDEAALTRIPGVGKKSAQRLILELTGKLVARGIEPAAGSEEVAPAGPAAGSDIVAALTGLGWPVKQAESAVQRVLTEKPDADDATTLREALRALGRGRPVTP